MAWEWSHSIEAYEYARQKLHLLSRTKLTIILAEWRVKQAETEEETGWDQEVYDKSLTTIKETHVDKENIADEIWDLMSEQSTCTNGGWEAWSCPYGCGCHLVPFSSKKQGG